MKWRRRTLHAFFTGSARLAEFAQEQRAARAHIEIIRDLSYGPHPVAHRLDVYRPMYAPRPLPVLLYIHGGAFTLCSKETHRGLAISKAEGAGYLVFNINYRLAPKYPFPAAISDACDAYRWVAAHAADFGGDPRRIVVAGESAGGNLALGVAIAATYRRPEPYARAVYDCGVVPVAVMPIMPYLQASDPSRHRDFGYWSHSVARDIAQIYLGHCGPHCAETLLADPILVLEQGGRPRRRFPEVFSGVGTHDMCCADVRRLQVACRRLGIPVQVRYYRGEVHAFHALQWRPAARRFWKEIFGFMERIALPVAAAALGARRVAARHVRAGAGRISGASARVRCVRPAVRAASAATLRQ